MYTFSLCTIFVLFGVFFYSTLISILLRASFIYLLLFVLFLQQLIVCIALKHVVFILFICFTEFSKEKNVQKSQLELKGCTVFVFLLLCACFFDFSHDFHVFAHLCESSRFYDGDNISYQ